MTNGVKAMKEVNLFDVKKMFAFIKRNRKELNALVAEYQQAKLYKNLNAEMMKKYKDEVIAEGEYYIDPENYDIIEDALDVNEKLQDSCYDYLISEDAFMDMLIKAHAKCLNDKKFLEINPIEVIEEEKHEYSYEHHHRVKEIELRNILIEKVSPFTGISIENINVVSVQESLIDLIVKAILDKSMI